MAVRYVLPRKGHGKNKQEGHLGGKAENGINILACLFLGCVPLGELVK